MPQRPQSAQATRRPPAAATGSGAGAVAAAAGGSGAGAVAANLPMRRNQVGNCAANFFSDTPTHATEPSSSRIAKLRQEINSETALMPTVEPKLADLQHPDAEHLLLGINLEGLREACELVGFPFKYGHDAWEYSFFPNGEPSKYKRKDHAEMAWLDKAYPRSWCLGYDFCCAVKVWLKANGHENESVCQVLLKRGSKNVRPANLFYSHTQGVELYRTIKRMREGIEAHKSQLPQATEAAKALAAEQRARISELDELMKAADDKGAAMDYKTKDYKDYKDYKNALWAERNKLLEKLVFPADESHLFFWLGALPSPPMEWLPLIRTPDASRVCRGRLHHAKTMCARFRSPKDSAVDQGDRPHAGGARHEPAGLSYALVLHSRASGHRPGRRQTARADALPQSVRHGGRRRSPRRFSPTPR